MAIFTRAQSDFVERFLLTSEQYLLSGYLSASNSKCAKHCVPNLRTCKTRAFGAESFQFRTDLEVDRGKHI